MRSKTAKKKIDKTTASRIIPKIPFSKSQKILFLVFLLTVGFYIGMQYEFTIFETAQNKKLSNITPPPRTKFTCTQYAFMPDKSDFLIKYTVKPGDSLLSIASTQLNDVSRVDEVVNLNKDDYPDLSVNNSFLEKGMTLYLPDKKWPPSDGILTEIIGQVTEIDREKNIVLRGPTNFISTETPTKTTVFSQNRQVKVGDCLKAVIEAQSDDIIYGEFLN